MSCYSCSKNDCSLPNSVVTIDPCKVTEEEFVCQVHQLFKIGPLWEKMIGQCCDPEADRSRFRNFIDCLSSFFFDVHTFICDLRLQAAPCTATCPDALDDWAEILCLDECPILEPITSELICEFFNNRGNLSKEWISRLVELELGRSVLSCETFCVDYKTPCCSGDHFGDWFRQRTYCPNETFNTEECETKSFRDDQLMFSAPKDYVFETRNTECERLSSQFPCSVNCCEDEVSAQNQLLTIFNPCEIELNRGGCSCSSRNGEKCISGFSSKCEPEPVNSIGIPYTIIIKIEGANPCNTPDTFGNMFRPNNFKLCLLEKMLPIHFNLQYQFEC